MAKVISPSRNPPCSCFVFFQYVLRMLGGNGNELESVELLKYFISACHCNEQGLITKDSFIRALSKNELLSQLLSPFTWNPNESNYPYLIARNIWKLPSLESERQKRHRNELFVDFDLYFVTKLFSARWCCACFSLFISVALYFCHVLSWSKIFRFDSRDSIEINTQQRAMFETCL